MRFLVFLSLILIAGASVDGTAAPRPVQMETPFIPNWMPPAPSDGSRSEPDEQESDRATAEEKAPFLYGAERRRKELDDLFATLAKAPNAAVGKLVANSIQMKWNESGSATVDYLMTNARQALQRDQTDVALDLLGEAIVLKPDYAEAWNLRATLHFLRGDWSKSMADIERVLALEPKHFGALTGMGAILQQSGRPAAALAIYERVLEIFPTLETAQEQAESLRKAVANQTL